MKNFVHSGNTLTLTAPAGGVVSGQGYIIGKAFVVAKQSAAATEQFVGETIGAYEMAKLNTEAFVEGDRLFWDNTNKRFTKTSAVGLFPVGIAIQAQLLADTTCVVRLDGIATVAV